MHDQRFARRGGGESIHERDRADRGPDLPELILRHDRLKRLADVTRALAGPHHVPECHGRVIEGADLKARVHGSRDEGIAGTETGAEHAKLLVTLLLKPVEAATDVHDRLAAGRDGAAQVGADGVVGALELKWAADVVVGLREAQGRDAEAVEERTKGVVTEGISVPLRHDDDGLFGLAYLLVRRRGIPACVDKIIFRIGCADRRSKS